MIRIASILVLFAGAFAGPAVAAEPTRGIGVYPGDPAEDFSPSLVAAGPGRRNLAVHRAATQSSAWDYNLTAQLVTDGIQEGTVPRWFSVSTSEDGVSPKHARAFLVDDNVVSTVDFAGPGWIGFELGGGGSALAVDRLEIGLKRHSWLQWAFPGVFGLPGLPAGRCVADFLPPDPFGPPDEEGAANELDGEVEWSLAASADGREWRELGRTSAAVLPLATPPPRGAGAKAFGDWFRTGSPILWTAVTLDQPVTSRRYRVRLEDLDCKDWQVVEVRFYRGGERLRVGGPHYFGSAWKSAGLGEEWVAVDLGNRATVSSVALHWLKPAAEGVVQISDDGVDWSPVAELSGSDGVEQIPFSPAVETRHLRLLMTRPSSVGGYVLSELEVFGEGGLVAEPQPQPPADDDGSLHLAGGHWRLQRDSLAAGGGGLISNLGYADDSWIPATVPGTVLTSYYNAGALPDPNYGANELAISDSFFHADFWYRNVFVGPSLAAGRRAFLELDGVNWKAEAYLNGARLGRLEGAFRRGRFDVTEHLQPGPNALAIRVEKPASPGAAKQHTLASAGQNGGALGADNPSYHAAIGWDWIPTIRGRNIGLWNDVHLTVSGPVTIDDPYVRFTLPPSTASHSPPSGVTSSADLHLDVTLTHHGPDPVAGTLRGRFGDVAFEQPVELPGGSARTVALDPSTHPQLRLRQPKLWWPNGHGEPHLYDVELEFLTAAGVSDSESFLSGVRQVTFTEEETAGGDTVPSGGPRGGTEPSASSSTAAASSPGAATGVFPRPTCATGAASTKPPCATTAT